MKEKGHKIRMNELSQLLKKTKRVKTLTKYVG